jgi:protein phosphatase 2C family protein 2/3
MEDSFIIIHDLNIHPKLPISIYAVLDGHGGEWCAIFIKQRFEAEIKRNLLDPENGLYGINRKGMNECFGLAIRKTFAKIDEEYYVEREGRSNKCGSTGSVVCIVGIHIFCANVGDSRSILSRKGKAVNLSLDHKASRPDEVARIKHNDGKIEFGRVGAKLAITRAFGDFEFKAFVDDEG